MQKEDFSLTYKDFLSYLNKPISFEDLDAPKNILYHSAFKKIVKACKRNENVALEAMRQIAKNISKFDEFKVFISAKLFLELVDYKNPSTFTINFAVGLLIRSLTLAERYLLKILNYVENSTIMSNAPAEIKAWKSVDYILEPTLTILSTSPSAREKLRANPNNKVLIQKLTPYLTPLNDISKLYNLTDNTDFTILHPKKLIGFIVTATGVQNNYHLFTLMQDELLQKANDLLNLNSHIDANALSIAKGERKFDIDRKITINNFLDFFSYNAYNRELTNPKFQQIYAIKGEESSDHIPEFQNRKIIIIDSPPQKHLTWDTHSFKPINIYTTSSVIIKKIISKDNVIKILKEI